MCELRDSVAEFATGEGMAFPAEVWIVGATR
jgi:hypothetical protein